MYASSMTVNLNASAAVKSYQGNQAQFSQLSYSLQATGQKTGIDSVSISEQALDLQRNSYADTIFYTLFGMDKAGKSSSSVDGIMDLFGVPDSSAADPSFHGGKYKTLGQVGNDFFNDFTNLTGVLGNMFRLGGVGDGLSMRLDGYGHVLANEDHASADKVNTLFKENSIMVSRFAVMAGRGAIVQAAESVPGFQEAYNEDPPGAIKRYIDDLRDLLFGFRLDYGKNSFTTRFETEEAPVADVAAEEAEAA
jgi:hypothetical protein